MPAKRKVIPCTCNEPPPPAGTPKKSPQKLSTRAGLIFSVARVNAMTKESLKGREDRVRKNATVCLTAALQEICAEIIRQTLREARSMKKVRIITYHLARAIHHNPVLKKTFEIDAPENWPEHKPTKIKVGSLLLATQLADAKKAATETPAIVKAKPVPKPKGKKKAKAGQGGYDLMPPAGQTMDEFLS